MTNGCCRLAMARFTMTFTIKVADDLLLQTNDDPVRSIVAVIYPSFNENYSNFALPGEGRTYLSSGSVCKASYNTYEENMLYLVGFLNTSNSMASRIMTSCSMKAVLCTETSIG